MIVRSVRSFGRDSPVRAYWLTCCKGFSVRANGRVVGVVEEVVCAEPISRAEALLVRPRGVLRHERTVPVDRVEAVVPAERALLLAAPAPAPRREPVIRPWLGLVSRRAAWLARRAGARSAPVIRRLARVAGELALAFLALTARTIVRGARAARAHAPVVRRSLARFAASSYRLR